MWGKLGYKYEGKMENGVEQKLREKIQEKIEKKKKLFPKKKARGIQGQLWAHKTQQKELGQENLIVFEVSEFYLPKMEAKRCYI